jgi:hypothetical protein
MLLYSSTSPTRRGIRCLNTSKRGRGHLNPSQTPTVHPSTPQEQSPSINARGDGSWGKRKQHAKSWGHSWRNAADHLSARRSLGDAPSTPESHRLNTCQASYNTMPASSFTETTSIGVLPLFWWLDAYRREDARREGGKVEHGISCRRMQENSCETDQETILEEV